MSNTNRVMGHNAERYYAAQFRELGYEKCITSRLGSRLYDNSKIDLMFIPFNIQIKAGKQTSLNACKELESMVIETKKFFPEDDVIHTKYSFLIHRKPAAKGKKRTEEDEIVYVPRDLIEYLSVEFSDIIKSKVFKKATMDRFKVMYLITFEKFKKYVNKTHFYTIERSKKI